MVFLHSRESGGTDLKLLLNDCSRVGNTLLAMNSSEACINKLKKQPKEI
jgi:hypothetical protein